ncbi:MAG: hypothetical protein KDH96_13225, partial [Candidatus Riesia sp.]|nr:hypothetical protein [Candidatus Riesia sp.]
RPEKVLFVILTDGYENDSRYYNKEKVFKMIDKMERKHNWSFIYLGANQDSFAEGGKMGVKSKKILNYSADEEGVRFAYTNISNYASSFRMAKSAKLANDIGFDDLNNGTTDTNK